MRFRTFRARAIQRRQFSQRGDDRVVELIAVNCKVCQLSATTDIAQRRRSHARPIHAEAYELLQWQPSQTRVRQVRLVEHDFGEARLVRQCCCDRVRLLLTAREIGLQ